MDKLLNFVAMRPAPESEPAAPALAASSDFQQALADVSEAPLSGEAMADLARSFIASGQFLRSAEEVEGGVALLALHERLADASAAEMLAGVRQIFGDNPSTGWARDATRARDSVLASYLLDSRGLDAQPAVRLVQAFAWIDAVLAAPTEATRVDSLRRTPLVLPDFLLGQRDKVAGTADNPAPSSDDAAKLLLQRFKRAREHHDRLGDTMAHIVAHGEDELVLSELGEQRPLASLYRATSVATEASPLRANASGQQKHVDSADFAGASPLRRAAARSNVILSDTAVRLLSDPARQTLRSLSLDPAQASVRELHTQVAAAQAQATQTLRELSIQIGGLVERVNGPIKELIGATLGPWKVDPVDEPAAAEPVASGPPATFNTVKPLGIADLYVVRTHISRYERGEVASLENILGGEKLTHTERRSIETETTETTDSESTSVQSLAQKTAEQDNGKTTAQAIGAGRGPLTSDGPVSFSKSVTDDVSSSLTNRSRSISVLRRLQRDDESMEHIFDHTADEEVKFGVYQWLDKIYEAQVFNYGSRLLYDLIVPEPAALFREALSRPRGQPTLPARPAKFSVPADRLTLENWSYYATGHQASGVDAPPQAKVIVAENFGGKAPDPFSTELNANTLVVGESRTTRIPRGYRATEYRLVAFASGWTPYNLRAFIGTKTVFIDGFWGGKVFSGKLDGEVEMLPVGLIADGNGVNPSISTLAIGIEIVCEPTEEAVSAWQTKAHAQIRVGNQQRTADYEERVANRDASARLQLQALPAGSKLSIVQTELKRSALAVLTNQNFSTFNANRRDDFGFPYPDAVATNALSAYVRFFEQAVEWEHIECAFFPYFWGSRTSWVAKLLDAETDPTFSAFVRSGAARVVLPIRPGHEAAFEHFLNTGKTPTTAELLDVGGPLWVSLVSQLRQQGAQQDSEQAVGEPWEFRVASDLVRARRDGLLPKWSLVDGKWVEQADATS